MKAQRSDKLASLLVQAMAHQTGLLADPTDLPFSEDLLADGIPDVEKVRSAVEDLIARKPHLADRRPRGSVDQGARGASEPTVSDLGAILRSRAG